MRLHIFYMGLCIVTFSANLCLSWHIFCRQRGRKAGKHVESMNLVTFKLSRKSSMAEEPMDTLLSDDTMTLK